jgi:hypothetical protein
MLHAAMVKQSSASEDQAHLDQLRIYVPAPGLQECHHPREKDVNHLPEQGNVLPPRLWRIAS